MHHELETTNSLVSKLETSGYGELQPSILPHELEALCLGDPTLETCFTSMKTYVHRYAHDVYSMMLEQIALAKKREQGENTREDAELLAQTDERRHHLHNALMDSINLMSRELNKKGKDIEWMRPLVENGRAGYATFALLTFYRLHVTIK